MSVAEFDLLQGQSDGRLFVQIYTGTAHIVVEVDENELTDLRERLDESPRTVDR